MPAWLNAIAKLWPAFGGGSGSPSVKPPNRTALEETEQNLLGKSSKIEVADQAVHLQDKRELMRADRQRVEDFYQKTVFGGKGTPMKEDEMGDLIVCDNMKIDNSRPGTSPLAIAGITTAMLLGGAGGYLWNQQGKPTPAPTVSVVAPVATSPAPTPPPAHNQLDSEWDHVLSDEETGKEVSRTRYRSRSGVVERRMPDGSWVSAPTVKAPQ